MLTSTTPTSTSNSRTRSSLNRIFFHDMVFFLLAEIQPRIAHSYIGIVVFQRRSFEAPNRRRSFPMRGHSLLLFFQSFASLPRMRYKSVDKSHSNNAFTCSCRFRVPFGISLYMLHDKVEFIFTCDKVFISSSYLKV